MPNHLQKQSIANELAGFIEIPISYLPVTLIPESTSTVSCDPFKKAREILLSATSDQNMYFSLKQIKQHKFNLAALPHFAITT